MFNNVTKESVPTEKHLHASPASSSIPLMDSSKHSISMISNGQVWAKSSPSNVKRNQMSDDSHLGSAPTRMKTTSNKALSVPEGIDLRSIQTIGKRHKKKPCCPFPSNWSIIRVILLILILLALLAVAIVVPSVLLTLTTTTVGTLLTSTTNGNTTTVTATSTSRF